MIWCLQANSTHGLNNFLRIVKFRRRCWREFVPSSLIMCNLFTLRRSELLPRLFACSSYTISHHFRNKFSWKMASISHYLSLRKEGGLYMCWGRLQTFAPTNMICNKMKWSRNQPGSTIKIRSFVHFGRRKQSRWSRSPINQLAMSRPIQATTKIPGRITMHMVNGLYSLGVYRNSLDDQDYSIP
jgi:hypothetical protein